MFHPLEYLFYTYLLIIIIFTFGYLTLNYLNSMETYAIVLLTYSGVELSFYLFCKLRLYYYNSPPYSGLQPFTKKECDLHTKEMLKLSEKTDLLYAWAPSQRKKTELSKAACRDFWSYAWYDKSYRVLENDTQRKKVENMSKILADNHEKLCHTKLPETHDKDDRIPLSVPTWKKMNPFHRPFLLVSIFFSVDMIWRYYMLCFSSRANRIELKKGKNFNYWVIHSKKATKKYCFFFHSMLPNATLGWSLVWKHLLVGHEEHTTWVIPELHWVLSSLTAYIFGVPYIHEPVKEFHELVNKLTVKKDKKIPYYIVAQSYGTFFYTHLMKFFHICPEKVVLLDPVTCYVCTGALGGFVMAKAQDLSWWTQFVTQVTCMNSIISVSARASWRNYCLHPNCKEHIKQPTLIICADKDTYLAHETMDCIKKRECPDNVDLMYVPGDHVLFFTNENSRNKATKKIDEFLSETGNNNMGAGNSYGSLTKNDSVNKKIIGTKIVGTKNVHGAGFETDSGRKSESEQLLSTYQTGSRKNR